MKLIHDSGYSQEERETFREIVFSNTVQAMRAILEAMESLGLSILPENEGHQKIIFDQKEQIEGKVLAPDVANALRTLWKDPNVQSAYEKRTSYQLSDSAI